MRRRAGLANLLTSAGILLLTGCAASSSQAPSAPAPLSNLIHRGTLEDRFVLTGELRAARSLKLMTPYTREMFTVLKWLAREGNHVETGDPVAQFDNASVLSGLEDQRQALAEADLQLQKTRSEMEIQRLQKSLELVRKRTERDKARLDAQVPETLRSQREFQEKQLALVKAEAALARAQRDLGAFEREEEAQIGVLSILRDKARRLVRRTEESLERLTLKAPQPGILLYGKSPLEDRKIRVGDTLYYGLEVVELPDLSTIEVEARLSDLDDGEVAPGMPARCRLDALPDRVFKGRVRFINPVAEEILSARGIVRFFRVGVTLEESDPRIMRPGMSVKVEVIRRGWENRLLVPRALLDLGASPPRLRREDGHDLKVEVEACGSVECALKGEPGRLMVAHP